MTKIETDSQLQSASHVCSACQLLFFDRDSGDSRGRTGFPRNKDAILRPKHGAEPHAATCLETMETILGRDISRIGTGIKIHVSHVPRDMERHKTTSISIFLSF